MERRKPPRCRPRHWRHLRDARSKYSSNARVVWCRKTTARQPENRTRDGAGRLGSLSADSVMTVCGGTGSNPLGDEFPHFGRSFRPQRSVGEARRNARRRWPDTVCHSGQQTSADGDTVAAHPVPNRRCAMSQPQPYWPSSPAPHPGNASDVCRTLGSTRRAQVSARNASRNSEGPR